MTALEFRKKCASDYVDKEYERYNPERGMLGSYHEPYNGGAGGYHTRKSGYLHDISGNSLFAGMVFFAEREDLYDVATTIIKEVVGVQDINEASETFGLWPYYAEEPCEEMLKPDYNMSDFNGRILAFLLKKKAEFFDAETIDLMKTSLYRAAQCSIKRNVSPDYTNISLMSLITIVCAGELFGDEAFFERGKERLRKVHKYNTFNGTFSEFNSPAYGPLALEEISKMVELFDDAECKKMAEDLNHIGWEMLLSHYDYQMKQLAAPHMRCYNILMGKNGFEHLIYLGTNGRYGKVDNGAAVGGILMCDFVCPEDLVEKYIKNKFTKPYYLAETIYKKNNIRTPDEETVIIRNVDSPDLRSFTYVDDGYSVGAFEKIDTWAQRNSGTVYWGDSENVTYLRTRCFNDEYDYCSGMVYTNQYKNVLLVQTGFVTDRGDFHYIIDKVKDGKLTTKKLLYLFHLGGACDNVKVTQDGGHFVISDKNVTIDLNITEAYFDGEPMELRYNDEKKRIEAVCFEGEKSVDFNTMEKPTYMVYTLAVNTKVDAPETKICGNMVTSTLKVEDKTLTLTSHITPVAYDVAIEEVRSEIK